MIIYRIEDNERKGPYWEWGMCEALHHNCSDIHPSPYDEEPSFLYWSQFWKELWDKRKLRFGFSSVKAMKEWFSLDNMKILQGESKQYYVSRYYVKECLELSKQTVFDGSKATLLYQFPIRGY